MYEIIELIRKKGIENFGRYYSIYKGIVMSRETGDNYTGKLLVYCSTVMGGSTIWANPKYNSGGKQYGFKHIDPLPGTVVYIEFEDGLIGKPLWSFHGWRSGTTPEELQSSTNAGFVTPNGHKLIWDDYAGTCKLTMHKNEKNAHIDISGGPADGEIEKAVKGDTLTDLLNDLIDAIKELTVSTPYGPSGTPLNAMVFQVIQNKLNKENHLSKLISLQ